MKIKPENIYILEGYGFCPGDESDYYIIIANSEDEAYEIAKKNQFETHFRIITPQEATLLK